VAIIRDRSGDPLLSDFPILAKDPTVDVPDKDRLNKLKHATDSANSAKEIIICSRTWELRVGPPVNPMAFHEHGMESAVGISFAQKY